MSIASVLEKTALSVFDVPSDRDEATQISVAELETLLLEQRGATPLTAILVTEPKLLVKDRETKAPNTFGTVLKVQRVNGMVNFIYDKGVLRRLEAEGKSPEDFKQGTSWHEPVLADDGKLTPLCKHKKDARKLYVRLMLGRSLEQEYRDSKGDVIAKDTLKGYLKKASDYANQGLDSPLRFIAPGLDTVKEISIGGHKYHVR